MKKCEWKDGKFEGCDQSRLWLSTESRLNGRLIYLKNGTVIITFCPCCGADIRKPEKNTECRYYRSASVQIDGGVTRHKYCYMDSVIGPHCFDGDCTKYRKPFDSEPKPTHPEIMTLWWRTRSSPNNTWEKVTAYSRGDSNGKYLYFIFDAWRSVDFFTIRASADIPPEAE